MAATSDRSSTREWNAHSHVIVRAPSRDAVFSGAPAANAPEYAGDAWRCAAIDGEAGTAITQWDGDPAVARRGCSYDVTVAAVSPAARATPAVIGVGGGRDVLTAICVPATRRSPGIEINRALVGALDGPLSRLRAHRRRPGRHARARRGALVPDADAGERFDVLQMSLIDTWAATGAGAFTLTENGLYTRDGWQVFLRALTPTGVFSVSRWFDPDRRVRDDAAAGARRGVAARRRRRGDRGASDARHARARRDAAGVAVAASPTPIATQLADGRRRAMGFDLRVGAVARRGRRAARGGSSRRRRARRARRGRARSATSTSPRRPTAGRSSSTCSSRAAFLRQERSATRRRRQRQPARDADAARAGGRRRRAGAAIIGWPLVQRRPAADCRAAVFGGALAYFALIGLGVHVRADSVPAALLGLPRPSDLYVFDHPVPDDSVRRPRQHRVRTHRRRPCAAGSSSCRRHRAAGASSRRCSCSR